MSHPQLAEPTERPIMRTTIVLGFTCGIISMLCFGCGPQPEAMESAPTDEVTTSPDAPNQSVGTSQQGLCSEGGHSICQGWNGSYRQRCLANCSGTTYWMDSGAAI